MKTLIRLPEVERRTAQSRSEIYKRMKAGTFPKPVKLARRFVGWVPEEVDKWIEASIAARDKAAKGN